MATSKSYIFDLKPLDDYCLSVLMYYPNYQTEIINSNELISDFKFSTNLSSPNLEIIDGLKVKTSKNI